MECAVEVCFDDGIPAAVSESFARGEKIPRGVVQETGDGAQSGFRLVNAGFNGFAVFDIAGESHRGAASLFNQSCGFIHRAATAPADRNFCPQGRKITGHRSTQS